MNTPNLISGSTPLNPVLAMPNLPAPQVISGTLGQQGNPPIVNPPLDLASFLNVDVSTLTDVIGTFKINTSMNVGTELFSTRLPVMKGHRHTFDAGPTTVDVVNWANVALCSHMYYTPVQHIGFVVIAPEPVKGKILLSWNPSDTRSTAEPPQYSAKRRMITEEWDLAESKTCFRTYLPNGLVNQMSTEEQPLPRTDDQAIAATFFITTSYSTPTQFRRFGTLSLFLEQEIQVGSIFPKEYTVIVFSCLAGTQFSVPVDPRRSAYSNSKDSLIVAHKNFNAARFNAETRSRVEPFKSFSNVKPPVLPKLFKN